MTGGVSETPGRLPRENGFGRYPRVTGGQVSGLREWTAFVREESDWCGSERTRRKDPYHTEDNQTRNTKMGSFSGTVVEGVLRKGLEGRVNR